MFLITEDHITFAESCLLRKGQNFNAQRRDVIKSLESIDVLACPGSGKTTALLAKLLIISNQLPLKGNRGICVLTHTNVAIDTITQNVGLTAGKLFGYPNHFGTIQSFVDKYLAIPAYVHLFGRRPEIIDNEWYYDKVEKQSKFLSNEAKSFCYKHQREGYPQTICFSDLMVSNENICTALKLNLNIDKEKRIFEGLLKLKKRVFKYGVLSFDDAYHLASIYVSRHPSLKYLFSKRFAYVFIDEMQDTDSKQINLLKHLFDDSVVVQRIGDMNQAIFSFNSIEEGCPWSVNQCNLQLEITGSKRFSNAIAKVINSVCVKPQQLTGNSDVLDIKPVIVSFDDRKIKQIIPWFASLILERKLHLEPRCCFKAIGWIGKPHENKHTIPSYWPTYQKELHTKSSDYSTLASYLTPESDEFIRQNSVNHYRKSIIRALLKYLRIADKTELITLHSERALLNYISTRDQNFDRDFKVRLTRWCLAIHKRQQVLHEIVDYLKTDFSDFFSITQNDDLDQFLSGPVMRTPEQPSQTRLNVYIHTAQDTQIEIQVCTIHGAKGETHTATLYLETFYHKYDVVRIIQYLKGTHIPPTQKLIQQNLRMAYVGMSRPTHLLCVAVHKDHLIGHEDELDNAGWHIDKTLT